jgi:hypothetical protein
VAYEGGFVAIIADTDSEPGLPHNSLARASRGTSYA